MSLDAHEFGFLLHSKRATNLERARSIVIHGVDLISLNKLGLDKTTAFDRGNVTLYWVGYAELEKSIVSQNLKKSSFVIVIIAYCRIAYSSPYDF